MMDMTPQEKKKYHAAVDDLLNFGTRRPRRLSFGGTIKACPPNDFLKRFARLFKLRRLMRWLDDL